MPFCLIYLIHENITHTNYDINSLCLFQQSAVIMGNYVKKEVQILFISIVSVVAYSQSFLFSLENLRRCSRHINTLRSRYGFKYCFRSNNAVLVLIWDQFSSVIHTLWPQPLCLHCHIFPFLAIRSPPYVTGHVTEKSKWSAVSVNFALL